MKSSLFWQRASLISKNWKMPWRFVAMSRAKMWHSFRKWFKILSEQDKIRLLHMKSVQRNWFLLPSLQVEFMLQAISWWWKFLQWKTAWNGQWATLSKAFIRSWDISGKIMTVMRIFCKSWTAADKWLLQEQNRQTLKQAKNCCNIWKFRKNDSSQPLWATCKNAIRQSLMAGVKLTLQQLLQNWLLHKN